MHKDFPLDPKTGTTRLIFHYIPLNVTIHIYTCRIIKYHGLKAIASKTMDRKLSRPKPCAKNMNKTIGRSTQPNIGSKNKIFWGATLEPIEWGYSASTRIFFLQNFWT